MKYISIAIRFLKFVFAGYREAKKYEEAMKSLIVSFQESMNRTEHVAKVLPTLVDGDSYFNVLISTLKSDKIKEHLESIQTATGGHDLIKTVIKELKNRGVIDAKND